MDEASKVVGIHIEDEIRKSYLDYAMSVIVSRALPDVRDGLKPVQRRILYAMYDLGLEPTKPFRKSARVVGEVLGKYHPHSDPAVYDAMVRLAQDFTTRYPVVQGHGNFGSVDGDEAAAMRYTEVRLAPISLEMLRDLDKETVNFAPNFDESLKEPVVLPSRFPNLLVNGSAGIAVGMATNIPPHNLGEVIDGILKMIEKPEVTTEDLMKIVKGPDFPTGGLIVGRKGIVDAYTTGRGLITMSGVARIEPGPGGRPRIIISELPFQVNKAKLIETIADLVRDRRIEGIADLRDETDRSGMRIVIDLRRDANDRVVLNQIYKFTQLRTTFGVIMIALVNQEPKTLGLRDVVFHYLEFQKEVVIRRTRHELARAEARAHILEGLRIALSNLDRIIQLIRQSRTTEEAQSRLMAEFGLSDKQAQAILDMQIKRLTGLEREKIEQEYQELVKLIEYLRAVLASERMVYGIIKKELGDIKKKFSDARRTRITEAESDVDVEDLIAEEDIIVTMTQFGYIKRLPLSTYRNQKRGGRGIAGMGTREEDVVVNIYATTTHHDMLFFTNRGKVFQLKGFEIPEAGRQAKGTAVVNLLELGEGEKVTAVIPLRDVSAESYLFFATKMGTVKRTGLPEFENIRRTGLIALSLSEGDELISVRMTGGESKLLLATQRGRCLHFPEGDVRAMGRSARGVRGIRLDKEDSVVGLDVHEQGKELFVVTARGYGKLVQLDDFPVHARGGKGVLAIKTSARNGPVAAIRVVDKTDEAVLVSAEGTVIRVSIADFRTHGRYAQGVTLMKLPESDTLSAVSVVRAKEDEV
ncbi:MAG: DNA gyrase subunit A [Bacillota bacterium]|nr:DNA gyrase subunit A [Bacillota bacterium]